MPAFQKARRRATLWLARQLPPCREITQLISESMDRKLTLRERITMRLHLKICVLCGRYLKQLMYVREAVHHHAAHLENGASPEPPSLSEEARERLKRALSDNS